MGVDNKHLQSLELFAYDNYQKYKSGLGSGKYIELKPQ